jgi:glycosyltransferase involved in cell wall biosynthesis
MQFYAAQYVPVIGKLLTKFDLTWRYERHVCNKYDLTHVATQSKKDQLRDHRFKEPIVSLTNGIPDYYFQDLKVNGIREEYGLGDKKVLLYASRMAPEKHPVGVIKMFKKIHKQVPDSHLLLVGAEGKSSDAVRNTIKSLHMEDCASYAGRVPFRDLLKLYNTADLSCLWSWIEAEGLVLIEAMAQGTPNIGANGYGISDVIRHGKTGYLANDWQEFVDRAVELLKDDDLRAEFGKNAKQLAQNYKLSNVARTWVELYKFAINELYPLRYYHKDRKERVELVKDFTAKLPAVRF